MYKQADIFQLCSAMDKLLCIETLLLKLIEVSIEDICIMHVQIIHLWEKKGPKWVLFNFKTVFY